MPIKREDDFAARREHLQDLTDEELQEKFWGLTEEIVDPLIELARTHTSPSIERSVLLRMGFNSLDAGAIVKQVMEAGLLGKGAGHVILRLARREVLSIKEAGQALVEKRYELTSLQSLFKGGGVDAP